jgi:septin family protein
MLTNNRRKMDSLIPFSMEVVTDYLLSLHRAYHHRILEDARLCRSEYKVDERVACILYFIAPHRLKRIDIEFMRPLSKLAPLGKAINRSIS